MFGLFGKKKTFLDVVEKYEAELFSIHGVAPTPALIIRFRTIFTLGLVGVLNDIGKGQLNRSIDLLVSEVRQSLQVHKARIDEISISPDVCEVVLQRFPRELGVASNHKTDGRTFFDAYSESFGHQLVETVANSSGGPFGSLGFLMSTLSSKVFNVGKAEGAQGMMAMMIGPQIMEELLPIVKRTS
jgi:hypothetical protein